MEADPVDDDARSEHPASGVACLEGDFVLNPFDDDPLEVATVVCGAGAEASGAWPRFDVFGRVSAPVRAGRLSPTDLSPVRAALVTAALAGVYTTERIKEKHGLELDAFVRRVRFTDHSPYIAYREERFWVVVREPLKSSRGGVAFCTSPDFKRILYVRGLADTLPPCLRAATEVKFGKRAKADFSNLVLNLDPATCVAAAARVDCVTAEFTHQRTDVASVRKQLTLATPSGLVTAFHESDAALHIVTSAYWFSLDAAASRVTKFLTLRPSYRAWAALHADDISAEEAEAAARAATAASARELADAEAAHAARLEALRVEQEQRTARFRASRERAPRFLLPASAVHESRLAAASAKAVKAAKATKKQRPKATTASGAGIASGKAVAGAGRPAPLPRGPPAPPHVALAARGGTSAAGAGRPAPAPAAGAGRPAPAPAAGAGRPAPAPAAGAGRPAPAPLATSAGGLIPPPRVSGLAAGAGAAPGAGAAAGRAAASTSVLLSAAPVSATLAASGEAAAKAAAKKAAKAAKAARRAAAKAAAVAAAK